MANYRKSFNFRNGVQVDDDNLVVNSVGNVGIGTTVPTELLDVRGTAKVGLVTASNIFVTGISTFSDVNIGGITIDAASGVITATSFHGDGATLSNLPTSQWVDVDVGLGFTSIYAAGNVGVGTTDPRNNFQIGGDPYNGENGVGVSSVTGNIKTTGIVSATSFIGSGAGVTSLSASNLSSGTISNDRIPTLLNSKLPSNINVTGIVTASTFVGDLTGSVTGNVTGTASTATSLSGTPDITVGTVTASKVIADVVEVPNTGVTTVSQILHVGTGGTAFAALVGGNAGIGTANPTSELQIRKTSNPLLEVISDTNQARISIGQSVGVGNSSGLIRFGNSVGVLDIINNDIGDIKTILHSGTGAGSTGNFKWIYGQTNSERMTLTYDGNLGINNTTPTQKLSVGGGVTVTGNVHIDNNLTVGGIINATNINLPSVITGTNLNNTSGITTLSNIDVTGEVDFYNASLVGMTTVGIGTQLPDSDGSNIVGLTVKNTISTNQIIVDDLVSMPTGVVTAATVTARFNSTTSSDSAVSITVLTSPNRIEFSVAGIGTTTINLV